MPLVESDELALHVHVVGGGCVKLFMPFSVGNAMTVRAARALRGIDAFCMAKTYPVTRTEPTTILREYQRGGI